MGGNGGCGEFDILEAIVGNEFSDMLFVQVCTTTIVLISLAASLGPPMCTSPVDNAAWSSV